MPAYKPQSIEKKWQRHWEQQGVYRQYGRQRKFYVLDMFPYPSGAGLHVGHPRGYIATDVVARMKQLQGYGVLHPMGWDAFGLPAEQFAIKNKLHPDAAMRKNVKYFKEQLGKLGFTYDWEREINTTDPEYYRWTQWIFLQLWKKGLAYESHAPINWCPSCQTGLANEDLEDGKCERCGSVVEQRPMRQWVLKMTAYADRLLEDLDSPALDWPESIKDQQRHWIGRSEGAIVKFFIKGTEEEIEVFTTRLDTIYGCTYVVVAPEHPLLAKNELRAKNHGEVERYLASVKKKTEVDRLDATKEKTGVRLEGVEAVNPFTSEAVPVYVADYVLGSYGTGAVMAVPAHDERDFEFAKRYGLPIKEVVAPNFILTGANAPQEDADTLVRDTVSAVVESMDGQKILLLKDGEEAHFPGGGIENKETPEEAIAREILEETGYADIEIKGVIFNNLFCHGFRHTKQKNQKTKDVFFHVRLRSDRKMTSEVEEGRHDVVWIDRDKTESAITWEHHRFVWKSFTDNICFTGDGILADSGEYTGLSSAKAREKMAVWLEKEGLGRRQVNYRMRDWVFSRQRYWGEPIPLVHCAACGVVPVPEKDLPVKLPSVKSYEPTGTGESPLAAIERWVKTMCPKCGGPARRETNTMPQWAGSCWYYLRYIDPVNAEKLVDKKLEKRWMPVDVYVGGAEHATRHLLYARFWHKFLFDIGVVSTSEPFTRLVNQGLILASDGRKMSKRWGNVVNPDDLVADFGADAFRLYTMFMGPFGQAINWNTDGVVGMRRFLEKVWRFGERVRNDKSRATNKQTESLLHQTIKKVTEDIEGFRFNTAVSSLMILVNALEKEPSITRQHYGILLVLLAPLAPHIAEELWHQMGEKKSIFLAIWPEADPKLLVSDEVKIVIQVNGKLRGEIMISRDADQVSVERLAGAVPGVATHLAGKSVRKVVYVPGRLVNFVVS